MAVRFGKRFRRLGSDERGVVFVYGAVIIFIALTIFGMTFDSMRYIEKKIISQNAADAAALEMAAWQARGLNVVQEINSDIYQIDTVIWETMNIMYTVAEIVVDAEIAAGLSLNIPLLVKIDRARNNIDKVCGPVLTTFKMVRKITVNMLTGLREVYVYGSNAAGFLGAIEAATANGASPVLTSSLISKLPAGFSKPAGKLTAIGVPLKLSNPFKLPVEKKQDKGAVIGGSSLNSKDNVFWAYKVFQEPECVEGRLGEVEGFLLSVRFDFNESAISVSGMGMGRMRRSQTGASDGNLFLGCEGGEDSGSVFLCDRTADRRKCNAFYESGKPQTGARRGD